MSLSQHTQDDLAIASAWFNRVFLGKKQTGEFPSINPIKQGCEVCWLNRSLEGTPLKIGTRVFARGMAVHSISKVLVKLPAAGKTFTAMVGRDQNGITLGNAANISFVVDVAGKTVFKTPFFHGGEAPLAIRVPLKGATEFTLRVDGQFDWGHADWADAKIELENGKKINLDELPFPGAQPTATNDLPFSFTYGGKSSRELLKKWKKQASSKTIDADRNLETLTFTDPATGLRVVCEAVKYNDFPAAEWILYFENTGKKNTPIIENVQTMDVSFDRPGAIADYQLHHANGSYYTLTDFAPLTTPLKPSSTFSLMPKGGRSSGGTFPFFNIEAPGGGAIVAVGWSGQWKADFVRDKTTGLNVRAGMELTRFKLLPGERVRGPRMLVQFYRGDFVRSQNIFRQLILKHYSPTPNGQTIDCPITWGFWGMVPAEDQLRRIDALDKKKMPIDYVWVDAGWYGNCKVINDWYGEAGNWNHNPRLYPNGLKPLSDRAGKAGMKFLLWFDPERVYAGSPAHREHPEWLLDIKERVDGWNGHFDNFLLNMGIPEAREWVTDLISKKITEYNIGCFREDFNLCPLPYWREADKPDRQGITEMKYMEGFYAFWDALLERHPGLIIDNCASGGQRIDIETMRRSVPLWRSDLQCSPEYNPIGTQAQTFGISFWAPLNSAGFRAVGDTYDFRSGISSGSCVNWPGIDTADFPEEWARKCLAESRLVRQFHYGDFYPLTDHSLSETVWLAYQLHRSDMNQGVVIAYRRKNSPYPQAIFKLAGLNPRTTYRVKDMNTGKCKSTTGKQLAEGLTVELQNAPDSIILHYSPAKK